MEASSVFGFDKLLAHHPAPYRKFLLDHLDVAGILNGKRAFTGPEHVVIDPTNRCDNNCIGCWTNSPLLGMGERPTSDWLKQELPYDVLSKLIDELARLGAKRVRFTGGGEPFMHPRLLDLVKQVKSSGLLCAITTNFTAMTEESARKLAEIGLDEFTISLWAATPQAYSRTHPNKTEATFHRIEKILKLYNSLKPKGAKSILANVIFQMNWHEIETMLDFALETNCDGIYYTVIDSVSPRTDGLLLTKEHAKKSIELAYRVKERVDSLAKEREFVLDNFHGFVRRLESESVSTGDYDKQAVDKIPCYVGWMFIRVLPNGDISPCCRAVKKPMGNLLKQSFEQIWNSKRYMEFREKALTLPKSHPYFSPIGCYRTCDNLMHNEMMHERIKSLTTDELESLKKEIVNSSG